MPTLHTERASGIKGESPFGFEFISNQFYQQLRKSHVHTVDSLNYDDFKKVLTQANLKVASAEEFRAFKAAFKDAADHFETHYRKAPLTVDAEASTSILKSQKIEDKDLEDIASHGGRPISLGKCPVATGHTLDGRDATLEVTLRGSAEMAPVERPIPPLLPPGSKRKAHIMMSRTLLLNLEQKHGLPLQPE